MVITHVTQIEEGKRFVFTIKGEGDNMPMHGFVCTSSNVVEVEGIVIKDAAKIKKVFDLCKAKFDEKKAAVEAIIGD